MLNTFFRYRRIFSGSAGKLALAWLVVATMLIGAGNSSNQHSPSTASDPDNHQRALSFLLSGMKSEIQKRRSGICKFRGSYHHLVAGAVVQELQGPLEGLAAFDGKKIRFDIKRPDMVVDPSTISRVAPGSNNVVAKVVPGVAIKKYGDDGVLTSAWHSVNDVVTVIRSQGATPSRATDYRDLRAITLFDRLSIDRAYSLDEILDRMEQFSKSSELRVSELGDGKWVVEWQDHRDPHWITRIVLTVDAQHGFVPLEYRCESRSKDKSETNGAWILEWRNTTDWRSFGEVYLPVHHESIIEQSPFSKTRQRQVMDFEWTNINDPVEDNVFSYKSFDLPEHVGIQDSSTGIPRWIKEPVRSKQPAWSWYAVLPWIAMLAAFGCAIWLVVVRFLRKCQ